LRATGRSGRVLPGNTPAVNSQAQSTEYFDDPTPPGKHLKLTDLELAYSLNVGLDWLAETREKLQAMGLRI
jgi:hypothetical protein